MQLKRISDDNGRRWICFVGVLTCIAAITVSGCPASTAVIKRRKPAARRVRAVDESNEAQKLLRQWVKALRKASPQTPVNIGKLVQPPLPKEDEDEVNAPVGRAGPQLDPDSECNLHVTKLRVIPTPALTARKPAEHEPIGFFVVPIKWVGTKKRLTDAPCYFGASYDEKRWVYDVEQLIGLKSRDLKPGSRPSWKKRGSCLFLEVRLQTNTEVRQGETAKTDKVVFVGPGDLERWTVQGGYTISLDGTGPNDATETRTETAQWSRVGKKMIFMRHRRFTESGGIAVGRPYSRTGTAILYSVLDENKCMLSELSADQVKKLRKQPGGDKLPADPPPPTTIHPRMP